MDIPELYCSLFVSTSSRDEILSLIYGVLQAQVDGYNLNTPHLEAFVRNNPDFDSARMANHTDGFLFYPFKVEIEPANAECVRQYKKEVLQIVAKLRDAGMAVVPACSFEDELNQERWP
jgi:hypothetical protein